MIEASIDFVVIAILVAGSLQADRQLPRSQALPMQWSFSGEVNWSAPRKMALAFTPVMAATVMTFISAVIWLSSGADGTLIADLTLAFVGLVFIAIHAFHLWLIRRTLEGQ